MYDIVLSQLKIKSFNDSSFCVIASDERVQIITQLLQLICSSLSKIKFGGEGAHFLKERRISRRLFF